MKLTVRAVAFAAAAVTLLVSSASPVSASTDSVSGRVVDVQGQPVAGVRVVLSNSTGSLVEGRPQTVTDSAGRYVFNGRQIDPLLVMVVPSDPAFASTFEYLSLLEAPEETVVDDLVYHRKGSISGTIALDAPSEERTAVLVSVERWDRWPYSSDLLVDEVIFDGSGSAPYRIDGVASGSYRLSFSTSRGATVVNPQGTLSFDTEPVEVAPSQHLTGLDVSLTRPPDTLVGVGPSRLVDTRPTKPSGAIAVPKVRVSQVRPLRLGVAGVAGVPSFGVDAVALNLTAVGGTAAGHLSAVPCGTAPTTSTLNFRRADAVANTAIVKLDGSGALCLHASVDTDVVVDLTGFVRANAGFDARTPVRLVDTRPGRPALERGIQRTQVGPRLATKVIDLNLLHDVDRRDVLSLNVTATGAGTAGFVAIYPCAQPLLTAISFSTLNYEAGAATANAAMFALDQSSGAEKMCITSSSQVDVIVDVDGVIDQDSTFSGRFDLGRLFDTRPGRPSRDPSVVGKIGGTRVLRFSGQVIRGIGMANVAVTNVDAAGYLTAYPCDRPHPGTSSLNYTAGRTVASLVYVPLPVRGGDVCIFASSPVDVVIDAVGGFVSAY